MQRERRGTPPKMRDPAVSRARVIGMCYHLLFFALGACCGSAELLFGVRPFGVALTAAVATAYLPATVGGVLLFCLLRRDYVSLAALLLLLFLRVVSALLLEERRGRAALFAERPLYRTVAATLAVFATGLYTIVRGGYLYYDLFGIILAILAAPLATFLYLGLLEGKESGFPYAREAGAAALVLTVVLALREISVVGIYPAAMIAALSAFLLTASRGVLWGSIAGVLTGLCFDWRMAPAFLLCALCFSLLERSSRGGGVLCGSAAGAVYGFLLRGTAGLALLLPSLLTAGALFLATDSAGLVENTPSRRAALVRRRTAEQAARARARDAGEERLQALSAALVGLSSALFELSNRQRRPSRSELRRLCDKTFDGVCPTCRHREICWGSEYAATAAALDKLAASLHKKGSAAAGDLPAALVGRCGEIGGMMDRINLGTARLAEEALHSDKTAVVAGDYAALGRLIDEAVAETREAFSPDRAVGERIEDRLRRMGYALECVAVCGKQHRSVLLRGVRLPGQHLKIRELRRVIEQHCRFSLGEPTLTACEGLTDITFYERCRYEVTTVKLSRAKGRGDARYCGDAVATVKGQEGVEYALLCDGMGSGNMAALTSAMASSFLTRLLQAGCRADTALHMLNGFLAVRQWRETEASTTVDLLAIDCIGGEATLLKCGAAPTFLLRRGEVTRFFSRTAPVGILETPDAEQIRFAVEAGDILLQVSDGVTGGEEDCPWLSDMLRLRFDGDLEKLARRVLGHAGKESSDDLSVLITEVRPAAAGKAAAS